MSPVQSLQLLRTLLYGKGAEDVIKNLTSFSELGVRVRVGLRYREWNCFHGNNSSKFRFLVSKLDVLHSYVRAGFFFPTAFSCCFIIRHMCTGGEIVGILVMEHTREG